MSTLELMLAQTSKCYNISTFTTAGITDAAASAATATIIAVMSLSPQAVRCSYCHYDPV
jgi:hypothetical protein